MGVDGIAGSGTPPNDEAAGNSKSVFATDVGDVV